MTDILDLFPAGLSLRASNGIRNYLHPYLGRKGDARITPEIVHKIPPKELLATPNFGRKSVLEIAEWMRAEGICLNKEWSEIVHTCSSNKSKRRLTEEITRLRAEVKIAERAGMERGAVIGWEACRKSIYQFMDRAAKSIARGFDSMNAMDDDNLTAAIRAASEKEAGDE